MATISDRYKQFYTHKRKIIDITNWELNLSPNELCKKYGWEGGMAYGNLIHDELNSYGPGVKEGDIVVDLGANIGMSSLVAEKSKASKIYCVEPDIDCYEILSLNKGSNWILDNVAIGSSDGYTNIPIWPGTASRSVRCITFDQYVAQHCFDRIDFLKVDIEGHEKTIFNNVSQSTWNKIRKIFIEYHENLNLSTDEQAYERFAFASKFCERGFLEYEIRVGYYQSFIYIWKL